MKILKNSIICKNCFEMVTSRSNHDYRVCKCGRVAVDGGLEYCKITGSDYIDAVITSDDYHEKIRVNFEWGSFGKNGDESLKYIKLCDMNLSHIASILETQGLSNELKKVFVDEIKYRLTSL